MPAGLRRPVAGMRAWMRPGDWLSLLASLLACGWLAGHFWTQDGAQTVKIRSNGKLFLEASLRHDQLIAVPGPLGVTEVEVRAGQARIRRDPSPRQYCVRQGWLSQAGQVAICLPNLISIELSGRRQDYDSLSF